jgi:hypothetical protein
MKADADIKRDVEAELKWDPQIDETDIAVKVNGGARGRGQRPPGPLGPSRNHDGS